MFNMVKGHYLQLKCCPLLFHNFKQFHIKSTPAHHSNIQKEMDELLAKGAIEPSIGGAGFYSNVFVVSKHTGDLCSTLTIKQFICYMHAPTFKMPTIRQAWLLNQQVDYDFLIISRMLILHIIIVKHHCHFYSLFGNTNCMIWYD